VPLRRTGVSCLVLRSWFCHAASGAPLGNALGRRVEGRRNGRGRVQQGDGKIIALKWTITSEWGKDLVVDSVPQLYTGPNRAGWELESRVGISVFAGHGPPLDAEGILCVLPAVGDSRICRLAANQRPKPRLHDKLKATDSSPASCCCL
jgi:hypothetical protein